MFIKQLTSISITLLAYLFACHSSFATPRPQGFIEHEALSYPRISVLSNGAVYNDATLSSPSELIQIPTHVEIDAMEGRIIKHASLQTTIRHGFGTRNTVGSLRGLSRSWTLERRSIQQYNETINQQTSPVPLLGHAQDMCNQLAHSLRRQGKSNQEIFNRNRSVHFTVTTYLRYETIPYSLISNHIAASSQIRVNCLRANSIDNRGPQPDIPTPDVNHITATTIKSRSGQNCAMVLKATMQTNLPNTIYHYQLIFNGEILSQRYSVRSSSSGKAKIKHRFKVLYGTSSFDDARNTAPRSGTFQILSYDLRSNVANYSIDCLMPIIKPKTIDVKPKRHIPTL